MKCLLFTLSFLFCITLSGYSQVYVDNQGNVYDQRKTTSTNKPVRRVVRKNNTLNSGFDKSKLSIGGGIGAQFGDYTLVNISPQVGYDFSKYFTLGAGLGYTYFSDNRDYDFNYKSSYLSFNVFSRFYPVEYLVVGIQPEISRMWQTVEMGRENYNNSEFVPSFLIGGGVRLGGMIAMIQYDVVQNKYSPYGDSFFYSVGYVFNF